MNFALKRSIKAFAVTLALSGTLIGGSVALANTGTGTINGNTIGAAVEKSSASGSDAHITLNTMLYYHETVSVNILNKNDNYVNRKQLIFAILMWEQKRTFHIRMAKASRETCFGRRL